MEDKSNKSYNLLNIKDLEVLNNKILDIKRSLRLNIAKILKNLDYEFPIGTSQGDKCFVDCVRLISIKCDLSNLMNDFETGINDYIKLEKDILSD